MSPDASSTGGKLLRHPALHQFGLPVGRLPCATTRLLLIAGTIFACPNWGSTINAGRRLLSMFLHPAVVPAMTLMSPVLGLNLLADGLREGSLKD